MNPIKYIALRLTEKKRLRAELAIAQDEKRRIDLALKHAESELRGALRSVAETEEKLKHTREKRNDLHKQVDSQRETIVNQAATLDAWKLVRNHNEQLIAEQKLMLADARSREERLHTAMQALNGSLMDRNAALADLRQQLTDAEAELERIHRPVLFARKAGMPDETIARILAGKDGMREITAIMEVLDEYAVRAMDEAAAMPMPSTEAVRGFSPEDRTFCSGGVHALVEFKRRIEELLATEEEKEAA